MRKLLTMVFVLALSTYAFAQDSVKIGYVDMQQALNESAAGKEAKTDLEKMVNERQAKIDEKIAMRDKLVAEIEKQSVVLSDDAKRQKQDELEKLGREVERLVSDSNAELQKQQREMELEIVKDLDTILNDIGKGEGYTLILPAEVILYSVEGIDITDEVIKKLNDIHKSKSKKSSDKK
jgi:outer membrane protein